MYRAYAAVVCLERDAEASRIRAGAQGFESSVVATYHSLLATGYSLLTFRYSLLATFSGFESGVTEPAEDEPDVSACATACWCCIWLASFAVPILLYRFVWNCVAGQCGFDA